MVEQAKPLFRGWQGGIGRQRSQLGGYLRRKLGDLGRRVAERCAQLRRAVPPRPLAKRFEERQVRGGGLVLVAAAAQDHCARFLRMGDQLLRQPGLAHARLARQQHQLSARLLRRVPVLP